MNGDVSSFAHRSSRPPETGLTRRLAELRALLQRQPGDRLAQLTGARMGHDGLQLKLWDRPVTITMPDFVALDVKTGTPLDPLDQALLAYYCQTADGTPLSQSWIAFSQLPDGKFYAQAFQGYTGQVIARAFGDDLAGFRRSAYQLGGQSEDLGHAAFRFSALPRVTMLAVCWLGDEDFPTSYRLLFDSEVSHYLPTDGCAILGSQLTRRLVRTYSAEKE